MSSKSQQDTRYAVITIAAAVALLVGTVLGCMFGFKAYSRYQARQDTQNFVKTSQMKANNEVKLNEIKIGTQEQRVKIEQQKAQIRYEKAQGIRKSQDEIAQTLTPLYVQLEMVNALNGIAKSGKNATVVYVPIGEDGLPVVADVNKK